MKKFLLTLCACAIVGTMSAQDLQKAKLYVPEFDTETAEGIFGTIYGVSANGMYAAGYDDFLGSCAFIWERSTGKFTEVELASMIMDASNDGTFVGNYWVEIPGTDGSVASRPGYYKDAGRDRRVRSSPRNRPSTESASRSRSSFRDRIEGRRLPADESAGRGKRKRAPPRTPKSTKRRNDGKTPRRRPPT